MGKEVTIDEFQISEVGLENPDADIFCAACGYIGRIHLAKSHTYYRNPNYDIIVKPHNPAHKYIRYAELSLTALQAVLDTLPNMICGRCRACSTIRPTDHSRYNPVKAWESLECHKYSS